MEVQAAKVECLQQVCILGVVLEEMGHQQDIMSTQFAPGAAIIGDADVKLPAALPEGLDPARGGELSHEVIGHVSEWTGEAGLQPHLFDGHAQLGAQISALRDLGHQKSEVSELLVVPPFHEAQPLVLVGPYKMAWVNFRVKPDFGRAALLTIAEMECQSFSEMVVAGIG